MNRGAEPAINAVCQYLDWRTLGLVIMLLLARGSKSEKSANFLRWLRISTLKQCLWSNSPNIRMRISKSQCINYPLLIRTGDLRPYCLTALYDRLHLLARSLGVAQAASTTLMDHRMSAHNSAELKRSMLKELDTPHQLFYPQIHLHPPLRWLPPNASLPKFDVPVLKAAVFNPVFELVATVYEDHNSFIFIVFAYGGESLKKHGKILYHYAGGDHRSKELTVSWSNCGTKLVCVERWGTVTNPIRITQNLTCSVKFFGYSQNALRELSIPFFFQINPMYQTAQCWDENNRFWLVASNGSLAHVHFNSKSDFVIEMTNLLLPQRSWAQNFVVCANRGYWIESCGRPNHLQHSLVGLLDLFHDDNDDDENKAWIRKSPTVEFRCTYGYIVDLMPDSENPKDLLILFTTSYGSHTFVEHDPAHPDSFALITREDEGINKDLSGCGMIKCGLDDSPWLSKLNSKHAWSISIARINRTDASVDRLSTKRDHQYSGFGYESLSMRIDLGTRPLSPFLTPICLVGQDAYTVSVFFVNNQRNHPEECRTVVFYKHLDQVHSQSRGIGFYPHPTKNLFFLQHMIYASKPLALLAGRDLETDDSYRLCYLKRYRLDDYNSPKHPKIIKINF